MSMLSAQSDRLREAADRLEGYQNGEISRMLREAADTILSLRDRLQESYGLVPEQGKRENGANCESYDAGFENGIKAVLQQLDGLIHEGTGVDEIQAWIDRQWEEET